MALTTFTIKQYDQEPKLTATLQNADSSAIDLSSAGTVLFLMRPVGSTTPKVQGTCTIVTPASGIVRYSWGTADLDTVGQFQAELEINWATRKQTIPNDSYFLVSVVDDIA